MALSYQFSRLRTTKRRWKSVNPRLHFSNWSYLNPFSPFRSRFSCAIIEDEVNPMTHEQNERLLTLLSEYLCFQPDAIARRMLPRSLRTRTCRRRTRIGCC